MHSSSSHVDPAAGQFRPHPNLGDQINDNICCSEIEGGFFLDDLPIGAELEVETKHHLYRIENCGQGRARISGHPTFCPEPVLVRIHGSTWGGAMLRLHFVGRGMLLEFNHPIHGVVRTSRISEIRELPVPSAPHALAG